MGIESRHAIKKLDQGQTNKNLFSKSICEEIFNSLSIIDMTNSKSSNSQVVN